MKLTEHPKLQTVDDVISAFMTGNELSDIFDNLNHKVYYEKQSINSFKHIHHLKKNIRINWQSNKQLISIVTIYHNTLTREIVITFNETAIKADTAHDLEYFKPLKKYNKEHYFVEMDRFIKISIDKEEKLYKLLIDLQELIYVYK
ncbi:hypothetical protein D3C87_75880 [compost metagenome]